MYMSILTGMSRYELIWEWSLHEGSNPKGHIQSSSDFEGSHSGNIMVKELS